MGSVPGRNCNNGEEASGVGTLLILNLLNAFCTVCSTLAVRMCPNLKQEKYMRTREIYGSTGKETNVSREADGRNWSWNFTIAE